MRSGGYCYSRQHVALQAVHNSHAHVAVMYLLGFEKVKSALAGFEVLKSSTTLINSSKHK